MAKCRRYLAVLRLVLAAFKYCKRLFYVNLKCVNLKYCDMNLLIKFHFMRKKFKQ